MTQADLASKSGVAQALVSQIENSRKALTDQVRAAFAEATQMPMTFFEARSEQVNPDHLYFRRRAGDTSVRNQRLVIGRFLECSRISRELLHEARPPAALPIVDKPLLAHADIEDVVSSVRRVLDLKPDKPVRHLMRAMERVGIAVAPLADVDAIDEDTTGHAGVSRAAADLAVVGYLPTAAGDRQRLTVGHELAHLVLHPPQRVVVTAAIREEEAHYFAAALLYPKGIAERDISESLNLNGYARIKARWGISIQALIRRGLDLQLISKDRYRSLMIQVSARGWRRREPVDVDIERPSLLWTHLQNSYGDKPYMRASNKLGMGPELLRTWIPPRIAEVETTGDVISFQSPN